MILTDGLYMLGCKYYPYYKNHQRLNLLDIPKGQIEYPEETPIETVIRETKEEIGLDIKNENLIDLGQVEYLKHKNLHLFLLYKNPLPNLQIYRCNCTTYHP